MILIFLFLFFFSFLNSENIFKFGHNKEVVDFLPSDFYSSAVQKLPIVCIDIFIFDKANNKFFLVLRKNEPAKNIFWFPGGRLFKNESFFDCAKRKALEEVNLNITPINIIDAYNLIFDTSEWDSSTHTPVIAIFALLNSRELKLNELHSDFKWVSLDESLQIDYLEDVRKKALKIISSQEL